MTKTSSTAIQRRESEEAIAQMSPALHKVYEDVSKRYTAIERDNLLRVHGLGGRLKKVVGDETKYGEGAVEKLAKAMNVSADFFYATIRMAEAYTKEELEKWIKDGEAGGYVLTYSNMRLLTTIHDGRKRNSLINQMIAGGWSYRELRKHVQEKLAATGNVSRAPVRRKSPKSYLKSVVTGAAKMRDTIQSVREGLLTDAEIDISGKALDEIEVSIEQALETLQVLPQEVTAVITGLNTLRQRLTEAQEEGEEVVTAEKDQEVEEDALYEPDDVEEVEDELDDEEYEEVDEDELDDEEYDELDEDEEEYEEVDDEEEYDELDEEDLDEEEEEAPKPKRRRSATSK